MSSREIVIAAVAALVVGAAAIVAQQGCAGSGTIVRQEARNALDCIAPTIDALQRCKAEARQGCVAEAIMTAVACVLAHAPPPGPMPMPAVPMPAVRAAPDDLS